MNRVPYTEEETSVIAAGVANGLTPLAISRQLQGRSRSSVTSRLRTMGYFTLPDESADVRPHYPSRIERQIAKDHAFKRAMLGAIKSGEENAPMGVVKDHRPLLPTHFTREPNHSCCSSSAAACAELGEASLGQL